MIVAGCAAESGPTRMITLATTTSMQDSGMLDLLLPEFRKQTGIEVKVVAVGSGQALEIARRGDADVLITHSPAAEQKFMDEGFGLNRRPIMSNDFVIVGPPGDPARIQGESSPAGALRKIANQRQPFVSRGDDSGTHHKELHLWQQAGESPAGDWYINAGGGMAQALRIASERDAYTLSDRGTFLALADQVDLKILGDYEPKIANPYSVTVVRGTNDSYGSVAAAQEFADFLVHPDTRRLIADFGVERFGQSLFRPAE